MYEKQVEITAENGLHTRPAAQFVKEAKALAVEGIEAGIFHDEGSGSNVDICVITKDKAEYLRNYVSHNKKAQQKAQPYDFPLNNTPVLH